MAEGDLTMNVTGEYEGDHQLMKDNINKVVQGFSSALQQIQEAADRFVERARVVSEAFPSLSDGAQTQSATVEEMTASIQWTLRPSMAQLSRMLRRSPLQ